MLKLLFMGTPEFAVPSLEALIAAGHTVCGVFSQPGKPVGRHQNVLQPTPVKECALSHHIPVYQPVKLRDGTALAQIKELAPDLIVVVAYGRLLPREILEAAPLGCINVHPSLLPKYRGSAPLNWPILNGDQETGVTIMHLVEAMDAGDMILQERTPLGPDETAPQLTARLSQMGAGLLVEAVSRLESGTADRTPQDESQITLAPMLSKELSPMDFTRPARALHNQVRGLLPWPAATCQVGGVRCKVFQTAVEEGKGTPGAVLAADRNGILVACGENALRLLEIQPDGKKAMPAAAFLQGHPLNVGEAL